MNVNDTRAEQLARAVLAAASVYDARVREPDPNVIRAWARGLDGLDTQRVLAAVERHYRTSTETLMLGHITELVHRVGGDAERHPGYKTLAEALASAEGGPGDALQRRPDPPALPGPRQGREALQEALDSLASRWASNVQATTPTGYTRRRHRGQRPHRSAADTVARLGREQRERGMRVVDGMTDDQRRKAGKPITICHMCGVDIPLPDGWDPADPLSPRLYCATDAGVAG